MVQPKLVSIQCPMQFLYTSLRGWNRNGFSIPHLIVWYTGENHLLNVQCINYGFRKKLFNRVTIDYCYWNSLKRAEPMPVKYIDMFIGYVDFKE